VFEKKLPPEAGSERAARHAVHAALSDHMPEELVEDVELVMSELVANGIRHARTDIEVHLYVQDRGQEIRVEVVDDEPGRVPKVLPLDQSGESGRGLHLLAALSESWGYEVDGPRKTVWSTLRYKG